MGKIRIDLDAALAENTSYYVTVDEGFVVDANTGEPSPAITDQNAITFTGSSAFETTELIPNDNELDFRFETRSNTRRIDITFEQDVFKGTGDLRLYDNDDTLVETFDVTSDVYFRFSPPTAPDTTGTRVTIYATDWFDYTKTYYVEIDDGAFIDSTGCMTCRALTARTTTGDATANFYYQPTEYGHDAVGTNVSANAGQITLEYCKPVILRSGNFYLYDSNDNLIETIPASRSPNYVGDQSTYPNYVANPNIELENKVVHLFPMYQLDEFTDYYVTSDRGVVGDTHGFSYGPLIKGDTDIIQTVYKPYSKGDLVIQFNRDVKDSADYPASGQVHLRRQADDVTVRTWDVKWNSDWVGSVNPYASDTENPTVTENEIIEYVDNRVFLKAYLAQNVEYYVVFDGGAFKDLDKIPVDAVTLESDWDFESFDVTVDTVSTYGTGHDHYVRFDFNTPVVPLNSNSTTSSLPPFVTTDSVIEVYDDNDVKLRDIDQSLWYAREMYYSNQYDLRSNYHFDYGVCVPYDINGYLLVESEPFVSDDGFRYSGETDKTQLPITISSCITNVTPAHNSLTSAVSVAYDTRTLDPETNQYTGITMTFDRSFTLGTGEVRLYRYSDDQLVETILVDDVLVTKTSDYSDLDINVERQQSGSTATEYGNQLAFDLGFDVLDELETYYIEVDSTLIDIQHQDTGIEFIGINTKDIYNFTVDTLNVTDQWPKDGDWQIIQHGVEYFYLTFNEDIQIGTPGNIYLKRYSDDATIETFTSASDISIIGASDGYPWRSTARFMVTEPLVAGERYYITVDANLFEGKFTGFSYAGISNKDDWDFRTFIVNSNLTVPSVDAKKIVLFEANLNASTGMPLALVTHLEGIEASLDFDTTLSAIPTVNAKLEADITAEFITIENGLVEFDVALASAISVNCSAQALEGPGNITLATTSSLTASATVTTATEVIYTTSAPGDGYSALIENSSILRRHFYINSLPDGDYTDIWRIDFDLNVSEYTNTSGIPEPLIYNFSDGSNLYLGIQPDGSGYRLNVRVDNQNDSTESVLDYGTWYSVGVLNYPNTNVVLLFINSAQNALVAGNFDLSDGIRFGQNYTTTYDLTWKMDNLSISKNGIQKVLMLFEGNLDNSA